MRLSTTNVSRRMAVAGAVMALGTVLAPCAAVAQDKAPAKSSPPPGVTIDQVLRAVQSERRAVSEQNKEREAKFKRERDQQQAELARIRAEVKAAEAEASRLEAVRNDNERKLDDLRGQLAERQGEFGELFGAARAAAGELNQQLSDSLVSAQFPGRGEPLVRIARSKSLPSVEELEYLWFTLMQEAGEQAKVVRFTARVIDTDNQAVDKEVVRIGPFVAFHDGEYLQFAGDALQALPRQPGGDATDAAERVEDYDGDGWVEGVIDPSLGSLLGLVVEQPTFGERVAQGGGIGYVIILVALFGIGLAIYKWYTLAQTAAAVKRQMGSSSASADNPLGRVMLAWQENKDADVETLQLKLDDAVLKEVPKLESGLNLVKVLAAVAPLMGLLGTVIGMIVTFQAITLFGTGDPKLMAGGISQALVTTVQGLVAAIPLLILHAFASSAARRIAQVLEEQSAGLIAEMAAKR